MLAEHDARRSDAAALRRRVAVGPDVGKRGEQAPDLGAPDSDSLAVDQAHLAETGRLRLAQVFGGGRDGVFRSKRVEVEGVFDRDALQTAGLSVVARWTEAAATAMGPPQTHTVAKLPSGESSPRETCRRHPSLTVRSEDQRRSEPTSRSGWSTYWTVISQPHFGHWLQK